MLPSRKLPGCAGAPGAVKLVRLGDCTSRQVQRFCSSLETRPRGSREGSPRRSSFKSAPRWLFVVAEYNTMSGCKGDPLGWDPKPIVVRNLE